MKDPYRYNLISAGGEGSSYTTSMINITGVYFRDIFQGEVMSLYIPCTFNDYFYYADSTHDNCLNSGYFWLITKCKQVILENLAFQNVDGLAHSTANFAMINEIQMKNIKLLNFTSARVVIGAVFSLNNLPTSFLSIDNLTVKDSNFLGSPILNNPYPLNAVSISNVIFSNVTIGSSQSFFKLENISHIQILNHAYDAVKDSDSIVSGKSIVDIATLNLQSFYENETIQNVTLKNTEKTFFQIQTFSNSPSASKLIQLKNIKYSDSTFLSSTDLISTAGFKTNIDLRLEFINLTFSNIYFKKAGNLINLGHQLTSEVIIENSIFENITSGGIQFGSINTQSNSLKSKSILKNNVFNLFFSSSFSFLNAFTGAEIEIENSTFTHFNTLTQGAILTAGAKQAKVTFRNSRFLNNSAFEGAIFNVEFESVVK